MAVMMVLSATAEAETPAVEINVAGEADNLTTLTVVGVGTRSVDYDGAIARFRVTTVRDSALEARQAGNLVVQAIHDVIDQNCTPASRKTRITRRRPPASLPTVCKPSVSDSASSGIGRMGAASCEAGSTSTACKSRFAVPASPVGWSTW